MTKPFAPRRPHGPATFGDRPAHRPARPSHAGHAHDGADRPFRPEGRFGDHAEGRGRFGAPTGPVGHAPASPWQPGFDPRFQRPTGDGHPAQRAERAERPDGAPWADRAERGERPPHREPAFAGERPVRADAGERPAWQDRGPRPDRAGRGERPGFGRPDRRPRPDTDSAAFTAPLLEDDGTPPPPAFADLGLAPEIGRAIGRAGYSDPTPVQAAAVPAALTGADLLVSSQTGSGKTAAFVWPALQRIRDARLDPERRRQKGQAAGPRVLVLAPTRELALQVSRAATTYGMGLQGLRIAHVVGGVPYSAQLKALRGPLDMLIATPGRLLDLVRSGAAVMSGVEMLVLDEADRMLDMGFIDDIQAVADACPAERQTLMFSATFAGEAGTLAKQLTRDPQRLSIDGHQTKHEQIEQRLHWADDARHKHALLEHLLADVAVQQAVVFTRTQEDADQVADQLAQIGHAVASLHGGMPQGRRNRVLQNLRQGVLRVLVATDVAARGIDVPGISHVINHGLPMKAEDYVHRIGRTGRAGRTGLAITLADRRDALMIRRIERFTTQPIAHSVVPGLEPRLAPPEARPERKGPFRPGRPGGRPQGAGGFRHGGPRGHGPR